MFMKGLDRNSYDTLNGSLAPIGSRHHLPARISVKKVISTLEEIDKNTDLLDISEDIAPQFHPSHSYVALQIRKLVRSLLEQFKQELSDDLQTGT